VAGTSFLRDPATSAALLNVASCNTLSRLVNGCTSLAFWPFGIADGRLTSSSCCGLP